MTVTPAARSSEPMPTCAAPVFDIEHVLASIDTMAAQRPVAAQIVSVANSDDTSARGALADPGLRRRPGQPRDEAGQLRLLRHARPGDLAAVRRHRRRLHHRAHHGDRRADQPRRRVAAARELLGRDDQPGAGRLDPGARASASARRTRSASACWPRWARPCCTTTTPRATREIVAARADLPRPAGGRDAAVRHQQPAADRGRARAVGLPARR